MDWWVLVVVLGCALTVWGLVIYLCYRLERAYPPRRNEPRDGG